MSSVYYKIGEAFKQANTTMTEAREASVKSAVETNDSAISALNSAMEGNFDDLSDDAAKAKADKLAALATKNAELATSIAALVTNATAELDSVGDLMAYLNANNNDWIATLDAKKAALEAELEAHNINLGDYAGFAAAWGVIYTRSSAAVPSTNLIWHVNVSEDSRDASGNDFPADDTDVMSFDGSPVTTTGGHLKYNSVRQWGAGGGYVDVHTPLIDLTNNTKIKDLDLDFSSGKVTIAFGLMDGRVDTGTPCTFHFYDSVNALGISFFAGNSAAGGKVDGSSHIAVSGRLASGQNWGYLSDERVFDDTKPHNIIITADSAGNLTVKLDGAEVAMTQQSGYSPTQITEIGGHIHVGDIAVFNEVLSGNDLASLEAYFDFKYTNLPSMEAMFQDLSKNYAGGFGGPSPIDSDYFDGGVTNTACYAYPEKYFKLGTKAEMTVTYAGLHASSYHQYMVLPRSKWKWAAQARNYDYVPGYQMRHSPGKAYGVYHRNYGTGVMYAVEMGDGDQAYVNHPGAPAGDLNPGDTVGFIVEWDGTLKLTKNGTVIYTYADKLIEDFIFCPMGVFGDWKLDMSGHMVDFDGIADIYGERFEGAELVTPTVVLDNGIDVSLGGVNANAATLANKHGNVTLGSLQGAGSYIEYVNANHPVGPHQQFELSIDTDSSNFTFTNAPYGIKRNNAHESQFYKDGAYVENNIHFCSRPFFGEWPYWHPAEYWETHGDDDTVENKTVGPCRIQLMEGNKLVCFVNGYPVWEQADFDVTQKWYFNLRNYHNAGASFENIKIKSVQ